MVLESVARLKLARSDVIPGHVIHDIARGRKVPRRAHKARAIYEGEGKKENCEEGQGRREGTRTEEALASAYVLLCCWVPTVLNLCIVPRLCHNHAIVAMKDKKSERSARRVTKGEEEEGRGTESSFQLSFL